MPDDPHDLQHDIALLERAIEHSAQSSSGKFMKDYIAFAASAGSTQGG